MGWTGLYRKPGQTNLEFFRREFQGPVRVGMLSDEWADRRILDAATVRGTVYMAVELNWSDGRKFAYGTVVLTRPSRERGCNFMYKDMTEFEGPVEALCPARILDYLSPLDADNPRYEYARAWRARCWENIR